MHLRGGGGEATGPWITNNIGGNGLIRKKPILHKMNGRVFVYPEVSAKFEKGECDITWPEVIYANMHNRLAVFTIGEMNVR